MNIFEYAAKEERLFENILLQNGFGYERLTTFYADLSIAEVYGVKGIKDTYKNVCESWIGDYKYFTEFVMCLNYKSWEWSSRGNEELVELYANLYYKARDKFYDYWGSEGKNDEGATEYYFNVMD